MYTYPDGKFTVIIRIQLSMSKISGNCLKQKTDFIRQKPKMKTVLFSFFSVFRKILTNPYAHYD